MNSPKFVEKMDLDKKSYYTVGKVIPPQEEEKETPTLVKSLELCLAVTKERDLYKKELDELKQNKEVLLTSLKGLRGRVDVLEGKEKHLLAELKKSREEFHALKNLMSLPIEEAVSREEDKHLFRASDNLFPAPAPGTFNPKPGNFVFQKENEKTNII